jgi:hypothetical protein
MKFLCLYRPGTPETLEPPNPELMSAMGALIGEMSRAGVLLATEGCCTSAKGAKLRVQDGKYTVTDGPFPETKELVSGYCLIQVKNKAEAVEWSKRFLGVMKVGECEIRQINEMPQ